LAGGRRRPFLLGGRAEAWSVCATLWAKATESLPVLRTRRQSWSAVSFTLAPREPVGRLLYWPKVASASRRSSQLIWTIRTRISTPTGNIGCDVPGRMSCAMSIDKRRSSRSPPSDVASRSARAIGSAQLKEWSEPCLTMTHTKTIARAVTASKGLTDKGLTKGSGRG
jgi:hypothetical protein